MHNLDLKRILLALVFTVLSLSQTFGNDRQEQASGSRQKLTLVSDLQSSESAAVAKSLDRIARAQERAYDKTDMDKSDERANRNLLAQESAVTWAQSSFYAAMASVALSGFALFALLYSLSLNRTVAKAAQDAVVVAQETSDAQSRAWVSVTCRLGQPTIGQTQFGISGIYFVVTCEATNHGRSPATSVCFHAEIALLDATISGHEHMTRYCDDIRTRMEQIGEAIFPEATYDCSHSIFLASNAIDADLSQKEFKFISPIVYGCLSYTSPHTKGVRQTRFLYHLATVSKTGQVMALRPDQPDWLDAPIAMTSPGTIVAD